MNIEQNLSMATDFEDFSPRLPEWHPRSDIP